MKNYQKRAALIKLASVSLAASHILRNRSLVKQALGGELLPPSQLTRFNLPPGAYPLPTAKTSPSRYPKPSPAARMTANINKKFDPANPLGRYATPNLGVNTDVMPNVNVSMPTQPEMQWGSMPEPARQLPNMSEESVIAGYNPLMIDDPELPGPRYGRGAIGAPNTSVALSGDLSSRVRGAIGAPNTSIALSKDLSPTNPAEVPTIRSRFRQAGEDLSRAIGRGVQSVGKGMQGIGQFSQRMAPKIDQFGQYMNQYGQTVNQFGQDMNDVYPQNTGGSSTQRSYQPY